MNLHSMIRYDRPSLVHHSIYNGFRRQSDVDANSRNGQHYLNLIDLYVSSSNV